MHAVHPTNVNVAGLSESEVEEVIAKIVSEALAKPRGAIAQLW